MSELGRNIYIPVNETRMGLCSRSARSQKDEEGVARCPSCSQNAHDEAVLVRCARSRAALATPPKEN